MIFIFWWLICMLTIFVKSLSNFPPNWILLKNKNMRLIVVSGVRIVMNRHNSRAPKRRKMSERMNFFIINLGHLSIMRLKFMSLLKRSLFMQWLVAIWRTFKTAKTNSIYKIHKSWQCRKRRRVTKHQKRNINTSRTTVNRYSRIEKGTSFKNRCNKQLRGIGRMF